MTRQTLFSLFILVGTVATVHGQTPAGTFEDLRMHKIIKEGDTVTLTEINGTTYKARVDQLTDKLFLITSNGARRELMEPQVRQITRRRRDPVWKGLLIGTGIGFAAGIAIGTGEACESSSCVAGGVLVFSGIGAGIGAAVDFAISKRETIYANPQITHILRISPLIDKKSAAAKVSISF